MTRAGLVFAELRRNGFGALALSLGVALGVAGGAMVATLSRGARQALVQFGPASDRSLIVEPPNVSLLGLGTKLDAAVVARFSALPMVESASPQMLVRAPASSTYRGSFFGQPLDLMVEIAAQGVEPARVAGELFPGESFEWRSGGPLPVCLSAGLLAIYNSTFAPSRGLPHLDPRLLKGFEFPVTFGSSMVGPKLAGAETVTARVVCVAPGLLLAGLTVPLEAAQRLNRKFGADADSYSSVVLAAQRADELPALETAVGEAGYRVADDQAVARRLGHGLALLSRALWVGVILVLALGIGLVVIAFAGRLRARAAELRLLRALGATRTFLMGQAAIEAAAIGAGGSLVGLVVAALLLRTLQTLLGQQGVATSLSLDVVASALTALGAVAFSCLGACAVALQADQEP